MEGRASVEGILEGTILGFCDAKVDTVNVDVTLDTYIYRGPFELR